MTKLLPRRRQIHTETCVAIQNDRTEMPDHNIFERGEVKNVLNDTEMRMNKRLETQMLAERKRIEIIMERKIDDLKEYLFREYKLDK